MEFEKYYQNESILNIFDDLIRRLKFCSVLKYINDHRECTAKEIMKKIGISSSTLYGYLDRAVESQLVLKKDNPKNGKGRAHYLYIAQPELKELLKDFKSLILDFL
jgi:DNA-binding MarR family transcriptional regulator